MSGVCGRTCCGFRCSPSCPAGLCRLRPAPSRYPGVFAHSNGGDSRSSSRIAGRTSWSRYFEQQDRSYTSKAVRSSASQNGSLRSQAPCWGMDHLTGPQRLVKRVPAALRACHTPMSAARVAAPIERAPLPGHRRLQAWDPRSVPFSVTRYPRGRALPASARSGLGAPESAPDSQATVRDLETRGIRLGSLTCRSAHHPRLPRTATTPAHSSPRHG